MCSQASLHIEDCENKVEGVGQQELSMQGVCLCVAFARSIPPLPPIVAFAGGMTGTTTVCLTSCLLFLALANSKRTTRKDAEKVRQRYRVVYRGDAVFLNCKPLRLSTNEPSAPRDS